MREQFRQVNFTEMSARQSFRFSCGGGELLKKIFLESRDAAIQIEKFRRKGIFRTEALRAPDARIVRSPIGLCGVHLRGADEPPTISLYQPGW